MTGPVARLLIVDDEIAQMRALCDTLGHEGFDAQGFSSPRSALEALRPGEFDLLLTDLMMPEMDGIALIDAARQIDGTLGAIVMTGHGTIDTAVQAMRGGALDYILKPFKLKVILPVIARALNVQRLRRENTQLQERERRRSAELAIAYQDLESFSYSVSHDLRAPIRSIEGFAEILEQDFADKLGDDGRRLVGIIRRGSQQMEQLIVGLLEFSRVGRACLNFSHVDMTALASQAASEVLAVYSGPVPRIDIATLPAVVGDPTVLRQVWSNLIGNALKYSAKRPDPQIKVYGWIGEHEAVFHVQDNGAGFSMQYADKLFGVFQRLHAAEDFSGTGVGLAIVQRIITRHGGRVWAESAPDAGARFQFALPLIQTP